MNEFLFNRATLELPAGGRPHAPKRRAIGSVSIVAFALLLYYMVVAPTLSAFAGALLITCAALLPIFLWLGGYVRGIPCFLLFSVMHVPYYAIPLVINHPGVLQYTPEEQLVAAVTVTAYLALASAIWAAVARSRPAPEARCLGFDPRGHVRHYMGLLAVSVLFTVNSVSGLVNLPQELVSLLRPFISGLSLICVFLLAYNYGAGRLSGWNKRAFLLLLTLLTLANCIGLLLITAVTCLASGLAGYWLSARKLPLAASIVVCVFLTIFQAGKYEMRNTYLDDGFLTVQPLQYPAYFGEWMQAGVRALAGSSSSNAEISSANQIGLLERASLMQMLLKVQTETPSLVPYFDGDSYVDIPELMLPRFLFPDKATSHAAMQRLSAHFGLITLDITERTSVAWGLLPEAQANFGFFGCAGLAVVMGFMFGFLARSSWGYSVFSVRSVVSIMFMVCVFGMESHAAAAVTTIFQTMVAVVLASALLARKRPNPGSEF
jgi:hypothetical protein